MNISDHDKDRGLYRKFEVCRTDGSSLAGEKHDGCFYFVLDTDHDPSSVPALLAYANSAKKRGFEALAKDLARRLQIMQKRHPEWFQEYQGWILVYKEIQP